MREGLGQVQPKDSNPILSPRQAPTQRKLDPSLGINPNSVSNSIYFQVQIYFGSVGQTADTHHFSLINPVPLCLFRNYFPSASLHRPISLSPGHHTTSNLSQIVHQPTTYTSIPTTYIGSKCGRINQGKKNLEKRPKL